MVMQKIFANAEPVPEEPLVLAAVQNPKKQSTVNQEIVSVAPFLALLVTITGAAVAYTSFYYRRQMATLRLEEQEKALTLVKQKYNKVAFTTGVLSTVTALFGYGICHWQGSRKKKQPKKKKSKTKVKNDKSLELK